MPRRRRYAPFPTEPPTGKTQQQKYTLGLNSGFSPANGNTQNSATDYKLTKNVVKDATESDAFRYPHPPRCTEMTCRASASCLSSVKTTPVTMWDPRFTRCCMCLRQSLVSDIPTAKGERQSTPYLYMRSRNNTPSILSMLSIMRY